jgi:nucleoside-diphosphate-sugar epimerase
MTSKPLVLVTGGSGYVAGHVCRMLASSGLFNVRTTVRSKSPAKTGHLEVLPNIEIMENMDLLDPSCWQSAVHGVTYIHHCASPFFFTAPGGDPEKGFLIPALQGTRNVVQAAIDSSTVKRIVLTSSCAAVTWGNAANHPKGLNHIWSEDDWQEDNTLQSGAYRMSKRVAEQEAWKMTNNSEIDLVTICPSFILGPVLSNRVDAASIQFMKSMLDGTMKSMSASAFGCVDVRNVAQAHIAAMNVNLSEEGLKNKFGQSRFILSSECSYPHIEIANTLRNAGSYGTKYPIPTKSDGKPLQSLIYSNARARKYLGIKFHSLEKSLVDATISMEEHGILGTTSSKM